MAEIDLLTSSDENDEDFVPEGEPSSDEGSSSAHSGDFSDDDKGHKSRKRRKLSKKKSAKVEEKNVTEEEEKKVGKVPDIDALWAEFKEDVSKMEQRIVSHQHLRVEEKPNPESSSEKPEAKSTNEAEGKRTSEAEAKGSSEAEAKGTSEAEAESKDEPVDGGSGKKRRQLPSGMNRSPKLGLAKVLEQLAKKDKMSTLAKSKLDWFNFKKSKGIEEEIKKHNKGKDGYLEKQDFLQRTDLRQFEIEKQLRAAKRNQ